MDEGTGENIEEQGFEIPPALRAWATTEVYEYYDLMLRVFILGAKDEALRLIKEETNRRLNCMRAFYSVLPFNPYQASMKVYTNIPADKGKIKTVEELVSERKELEESEKS